MSLKVVVWEVPDIKKGFLAESQIPGEEGLYRLKTEGVNMQVLYCKDLFYKSVYYWFGNILGVVEVF